ncbi:MAG: hypothetical protein WC325_10505 [Candidatus Bathyarchaeia archaeon]|jgi:hypothetical protein
MATDDYKVRYGKAFKDDFAFSKEYSRDANQILLKELSTIINYETQVNGQPHPLDQQGYDRKINLSFGFGVRTRDKKYLWLAEFTVDYKEWQHDVKDPHYYYFYAYAQRPPELHKLNFWMVFDYRRLKQVCGQGLIKPSQGKNKEHSTVGFLGFSILDLYKNNLIIAYDGEPQILENLSLPKRLDQRIDRIEVIV